ncbi:MAG TPA: twin-arginine translocase TatA/TatE family subunit [Anaerolineae bacterium]
MVHLGVTELLIILLLVLIVFGPRRLPEFSHGIAKSIRDLRRAVKGPTPEDLARTEKATDSC